MDWRLVWRIVIVGVVVAVALSLVFEARGVDLLKVQLERERTQLQAYQHRVLGEIRQAQSLSVQPPRTTRPPLFGPYPKNTRGRSTRAQLRRVREQRRRFTARALPVLRAWRATVPRVPAYRIREGLRVAACEAPIDRDRDGVIEPPREIDWRNRGRFHGGFQFEPNPRSTGGTWGRAVRIHKRKTGRTVRARFAWQASPRVQFEVAVTWLDAIGGTWQQRAGWPVCGRFA